MFIVFAWSCFLSQSFEIAQKNKDLAEGSKVEFIYKGKEAAHFLKGNLYAKEKWVLFSHSKNTERGREVPGVP